MKKQLLVLAIFVVAVFAGATKTYGQCDDALKPIAGKMYTYSVTVNPTGGTYDWFVTTDPHISTAAAILNGSAGGDIIAAGTGYNTVGSTSATVDITWTSKAVAAANALINKYSIDKNRIQIKWFGSTKRSYVKQHSRVVVIEIVK